MQFNRRRQDVPTHKRRVSDVARCHSHVHTLSHLRRLIEDRASTLSASPLGGKNAAEADVERGQQSPLVPVVVAAVLLGGFYSCTPSISHVLPAEQK